MNRNQIFTTIEFNDSTIRMTVGEYYNEKYYIFDTYKCKCAGLQNSVIEDLENVEDTVKELKKKIEDSSQVTINDIVVCLPINHIKINEFNSTSPVTGNGSLICQYDISEAYKTTTKYRNKEDEKVIGVSPMEYTLDDGKVMDTPPLREKSTTFKTLFNVYTMPLEMFNDYLEVINSLGITPNKYYLTSECLYNGIYSEDDISCTVLNIGKNNTDLLIYKKGKLENKLTVEYGTALIEQTIKDEFSLTDDKTIKDLLYKSAICDGTARSYLSVCKKEENKYISEKEISDLVELNMSMIINKLLNKAKNIDLNDYLNNVTGEGCRIRGIDNLLLKLTASNFTCYISKTMGFKDPTYCKTNGLITLNYKNLSQNKYINLQNNNYNDIMIEKAKDSKFDKFILDEDDLD